MFYGIKIQFIASVARKSSTGRCNATLTGAADVYRLVFVVVLLAPDTGNLQKNLRRTAHHLHSSESMSFILCSLSSLASERPTGWKRN